MHIPSLTRLSNQVSFSDVSIPTSEQKGKEEDDYDSTDLSTLCLVGVSLAKFT
jgi:hypothetical protein